MDRFYFNPFAGSRFFTFDLPWLNRRLLMPIIDWHLENWEAIETMASGLVQV